MAILLHVLCEQIVRDVRLNPRSAARMTDMMWKQRTAPAVGEVIIRYDWKQNLTTPMANVETADMFYGTARMEMSVFGALVIQSHDGDLGVTVSHLVLVSPIIDHTALFSGVMLDAVMAHVRSPGDLRQIRFCLRAVSSRVTSSIAQGSLRC